MKDDNKAKEVASDTITARTTPATKAAYERLLDAMEGDSKTEKFRNLVRIAGEANALTATTGDDRSEYEEFLLHTTRLSEIFSALLTKKNELKDQIYTEFQSKIESKDKTIIDLQTAVAEKENQIQLMSEDMKGLEEQIQSLGAIAKEVDSAREKAMSAEESLKDSRMICVSLQEEIARLKQENEGYDELRVERDDLKQDKEKLSERLEEKTVEVEELKKKLVALESKYEIEKDNYEAEKDARKQEQAEHTAEMARASIDASKDKEAAVQFAREDERNYWRDQVIQIQNKLDAEREKHDQERRELDDLKISALEKEILELREQAE